MTDTVDIAWEDGTIRSVPADAVVKTRDGFLERADCVNNMHNPIGVAVMAEAPLPPVAKPKGIDPKTLKDWTLCEVQITNQWTGEPHCIQYYEVKWGNGNIEQPIILLAGRGDGAGHDPLPEGWVILRTIHRPTEGVNTVHYTDAGEVLEFNGNIAEQSSENGTMSIRFNLQKHIVDGDGRWMGLFTNDS